MLDSEGWELQVGRSRTGRCRLQVGPSRTGRCKLANVIGMPGHNRFRVEFRAMLGRKWNAKRVRSLHYALSI